MKKDSFTFSDKLKKSKTLPLSKRIPSRIGGEVKAKRTLFERAQRDLPFIIVAALALLLLPFLSRESGDIDTPSVVWGDGSDGYLEEFNQPKSAEGEIALSSFRNPLDLILRRGGEDSSAKDAIDTYGAGSESEESSGSYERSSYGSEYDSSAPATSTYGKTVRRSVRNSINRVPTTIGSLRAGSLVAPNGGSGVGHSMAFGSRARDAAARVQGPGVRPVALQPLTAAGKGRNLTGNDALYAEAARSIGAFNRPGAKQALMDAQLKDVDGKPLGDTQAAAAGAGDPYRPGAAGGLNNNWIHTPIKPWWWDMMQKRSQMRWELWHYNWEKMASDSLIKLTAGLASCMITGSNDFAVGKFLGDYRGDDNVLCMKDGQEAFISFNDFIDRLKVSGGKDGSGSAVQQGDWYSMCEKAGGKPDFKGASGYKSALDVRLRCLGIRLGDIKAKTEVKRSGICDMYGDPMSINIEITKNGKEKANKIKQMGYYLVSNKVVKESVDVDKCTQITEGDNKGQYNCQCITAVHKAKYGKNTIDEAEAENLSKVVVFRAESDITSEMANDDIYLGYEQKDDMDSAAKATSDKKKEIRKSEDDRKAKKLQLKHVEDVDTLVELASYDINNSKYKGCFTEKDFQEIMKPIGKWRTAANAKKRLNEIAVCPAVNRFKGTKYNPVFFAKDDSQKGEDDSDVRMVDCQDHEVYVNNVPSWHRFSTTIMNPGKRTIAFVLEHVQGADYGKDYSGKDGGVHADSTGWVVKRKIDYSTNAYNYAEIVKNNGDGSTTFIGDVQIGLSANATSDENTNIYSSSTAASNTAMRNKALPGEGRIYWVTTDDDDKKTPGIMESGFLTEPDIEKIFPGPSKKYAVCKYRWGCGDGNLCSNRNDDYDAMDKYCFVLKDKTKSDSEENRVYYQAIEYQGYRFISKPKTPVHSSKIIGRVYQCDPLCKYIKNGSPIGFGIEGQPNAEEDIIPWNDIIDLVDSDCPVCNKETSSTESTPANIGFCVHKGKAYHSKLINGEPIRYDHTPMEGMNIVGLRPCTPICAKKAAALGLDIPQSPEDIEDITADPQGRNISMPKQEIINIISVNKFGPTEGPNGEDPLCPFCNPEGEEEDTAPLYCKHGNPSSAYPCELKNGKYIPTDTKPVANVPTDNLPPCDEFVCRDPQTGEPCPCIRVDNPSSPAINPLYVRSKLGSVDPKDNMADVTPICHLKEKGITYGNIYVNNNGIPGDQVIPDQDIVDMLKLRSEAEQLALCPVCNVPRITSRAINFENASYSQYYKSSPDFQEIKQSVIDDAVALGETTFTIFGYASPLNTGGCETCNDKLAYDRAIHLYNKMVELAQDDYNIASPRILTQVPTDNYSQGRDYTENVSWPKRRIRQVTPKANSGKPTIYFIIKSHAITQKEVDEEKYKGIARDVKISGSVDRNEVVDLQEDARSAIIAPRESNSI